MTMSENSDTRKSEFEARLAELEAQIVQLRETATKGDMEASEKIDSLQKEADEVARELFKDLGAWDKVTIARHEKRPYALDYIEMIFDEFMELHGDRRFGDDGAIVAGLGILDEKPVAVVAQQKGRTANERKQRNFGMARPEGYRKAMRIMQIAARMGRPIVSFIDTPGADCLEDSEGRGISEAIAANLRDMFNLPVPVVAVVLGEGGSGGALGIGVANRIYMLENAYYSVIAPESCAAILWRNPELRREAADALKLTAQDALKLGIIDGIVPEPAGGAHRNPTAVAGALRTMVLDALAEMSAMQAVELQNERYEKFRVMGSPEGLQARAEG